MQKIFILFLVNFPLFFLFLVPPPGFASNIPAPFFCVRTGDDQELNLDMLKGKVVSVWYETKEVVEKNKTLKNALKNFYLTMPENLKAQYARVPVIKCSPAPWPIIKIWKYKLQENSKREGITLYGDWDGKMFTDCGMKDNESNFVIIDKKGFIRYRAAGQIKDEEIKKIIELLENLLKESYPNGDKRE
jgi:predicted transcriptional regulator